VIVQLISGVIAAALLCFGLYLPRHQRGDMVVGMLVLSIGVGAMTIALSRTTSGGTGLGLGLFAILSIIRLRSDEIAQQDVAYYFAALALGLLGGLEFSPNWWSPALMAAVLVAVFVGDHPKLTHRKARTLITLDRTFTDETEMRAHLTELLGTPPTQVRILKIDKLNDTTQVDTRYHR
jgi:hypothetical protein